MQSDWPEKARKEIRDMVLAGIKRGFQEKLPSTYPIPNFLIEVPRVPERGHFAVNAPLVLASMTGLPVERIGQVLLEHIQIHHSYVEKVVFAHPGFLNFSMKAEWFYDALLDIFNESRRISAKNGGMMLDKVIGESQPLFYAQYTASRIRRMVDQMEMRGIEISQPANINFELLKDDREMSLIRRLMDYPSELKWIGGPYEFRFHRFIRDLVQGFQEIYNGGLLREKNEKLLAPRLVLISSVGYVLESALRALHVGVQ